MDHEARLALIMKPFSIVTWDRTARWAGCNTGGYLVADAFGGRRTSPLGNPDTLPMERGQNGRRRSGPWAGQVLSLAEMLRLAEDSRVRYCKRCGKQFLATRN